ncbi:MAG: glucose 1-dehydrogenase [Dehalococcoidia bacterium]|nr:glucose 1-dehydrogenase [Dehalococcoidia bacterium]
MHVAKLFDLTGKVAIVTGGSRGLGKEMSIGLGEAGAKVAITARREQWLMPACEEMESLNIDCLALKGDVTRQADVKQFVSETVAKWGRVDILINNAGISWGAPAEEMPLDKWDAVVATNLTGLFMCCQEVGKQMIGQGGGIIINTSSIAGLFGIDPQVMQAVGYHASKGGVISMTKQLAVEWARHNIRVNAIAPFFFRTRMATGVIEQAGEGLLRQIPMGRIGKEGEVKGVVVFLASDASSYITGQVICVDGGAAAW